jgi:hypothetical protein
MPAPTDPENLRLLRRPNLAAIRCQVDGGAWCQSRRPNAQYTYLFREPPNAKGNWQPDHDHVHNQPLQHVVQFVGAPIL